MSQFWDLIDNHGLASALFAAAILAAVGAGWRRWRDRRDTQRICDFLTASARDTEYTFRSTERIASETNLPEPRVETLCAKDPRIRRNEKSRQSWRLR